MRPREFVMFRAMLIACSCSWYGAHLIIMMPTIETIRSEKPQKRTQALAAGGLAAGLLASSCCLLPLLLLSLGISGAWIAQLTALAPYQPLFLGIAMSALGLGVWRTYRRPSCEAGSLCENRGATRITKVLLWLGVVSVLAAMSVNLIVTLIV